MSTPPAPAANPVARYLPALVPWLFAAGFLWLTYRLPESARAMPKLVGWTTLALATLDLVSRMANPIGAGLMRALNPAGLAPHHEDEQSAIGLATGIALVAVLIGAFLLVGVLPAAAIVIFGAIMVAYPRQWLSNLVIAGGATTGIWLLFAVLLRLALYRGILFGDVL